MWRSPWLRERCEFTPVLTHAQRSPTDCQMRTAPTARILEGKKYVGGAESSRRVTLGISACILGGQGVQQCQFEAALDGPEPPQQEQSQCSITVTLQANTRSLQLPQGWRTALKCTGHTNPAADSTNPLKMEAVLMPEHRNHHVKAHPSSSDSS